MRLWRIAAHPLLGRLRIEYSCHGTIATSGRLPAFGISWSTIRPANHHA